MNNSNSKYPTFLLCILLFCIFACTERIDINTEASPPRLAIYGYITTDTIQHGIRITRSTGYFDTVKPEGISKAIVSLSYDGETIALNESPDEQGLYLTSSDVYGIQGKTYTFHASLDFDNDGKAEEYEATSYMPFPAILDSVALAPSTIIDNFLQVLVWGSLPEESSKNFNLRLFRNGIAMRDSLRGFFMFQDDLVINKKFAALPTFQLDPENENEKLSPGDILTVQIESFTSEYATFIENAQQELRGPVPLFGGPPANLETNIRCISPGYQPGVSGFFTTYSKHRTHLVVGN
jgi:hypothetical protein